MAPVDIGEWSDPDKFVARLCELALATPGTPVVGGLGAWTVCYSWDEKQGHAFSARVRRSTKERDWLILGRMAARAGAPKSSTPKTIETNATATHYWLWGAPVTPPSSMVESVSSFLRGLLP